MSSNNSNSSIRQSKTDSALIKEMQRCVAVAALDAVYAMNTMTTLSVQRNMEAVYHGNNTEHNVSYVNLCLEGKNQFGHLWESGTEDTTVHLKKAISRTELLLTSGGFFTHDLLSRATMKGALSLMAGRTLLDSANLCLKNMKKAQAFAYEFLGPPPLYEYSSGTNELDLDEFVLNKMFLELKGASPGIKVSTVDDGEGCKVIARPSEWMFPGWIAFKCFGPKAPETYQSTLIELGEYRGGPRAEAGRAFARSAGVRGNTRETERDLPNGTAIREISTSAFTQNERMAIIAQNRADTAQRQYSDQMIGLSTLISSCNKEIAAAIQLLQYEEKDSQEFLAQKEEIIVLRKKLKDYKLLLESHVTRSIGEPLVEQTTGNMTESPSAKKPKHD
jgi:hypothetical protein